MYKYNAPPGNPSFPSSRPLVRLRALASAVCCLLGCCLLVVCSLLLGCPHARRRCTHAPCPMSLGTSRVSSFGGGKFMARCPKHSLNMVAALHDAASIHVCASSRSPCVGRASAGMQAAHRSHVGLDGGKRPCFLTRAVSLSHGQCSDGTKRFLLFHACICVGNRVVP